MKLFEARRPATLEEVSWLRKALRRQLLQLRVGADITDEVVLAVAELAANAVRHAWPRPTEIALTAELDGIVLTLTLEEDGGPFEAFPKRWAGATLGGTGADGTSGRGLALARSALDRADYVPGTPNRLVARRQLARRRPLVLVVEDEDILLDTYLNLLEPHYRVLGAATLKEALALARETRVDLIVTDFHLAGEPGTALVEALEDDTARPPIPIVMITGDPSVRVRALELGVDTFLTKPVRPEALLETVKLALVRAMRQRARLFRYFGSALEDLVRPTLPERIGPFCATLRTDTADIGGGDLVVHLPLEGRERVVLVDVMGHGINAKAGAVAQAAMLRGLNAAALLPPADLLARWSGVIFSEPAFDAALATALVVDLYPDGSIEIASAGHPHPMVVGAGGARSLAADGPLLGFTDAATYDAVRLRLAPGERLVLATDGLDPAELASGGPCPDWLIDILKSQAGAPLERAASRAAGRIAARLGPSPEDDWMLILIEAAAPEGAGPDETMEGEEGAETPLHPAPVETVLPGAPEPSSPQSAAAPALEGPTAEVDFSGVAALRRAVGEDNFQRLASRFVDGTGQRFMDWAELVEREDADALVGPAHALAGLLGQFGLNGAAALARSAERDPDAAARLAAARLVVAQAEREVALLKAWLGEPLV
ncbi:SpoIIE family protein phosphatase [Aquabacter sp. L1I39]|uniref:SpoIIE family protein phosphatase n=1 Tax=Aquabacter sp. L1I39 TaxID=2820278 RepID=UPI001ADA3601|nr:SpoIIE family protein phosphatase [Aquabacter sp. L1I39]QTL05225.1 SpoIIE family protein phosphatase [Aquabacter sp. L1I39]